MPSDSHTPPEGAEASDRAWRRLCARGTVRIVAGNLPTRTWEERHEDGRIWTHSEPTSVVPEVKVVFWTRGQEGNPFVCKVTQGRTLAAALSAMEEATRPPRRGVEECLYQRQRAERAIR